MTNAALRTDNDILGLVDFHGVTRARAVVLITLDQDEGLGSFLGEGRNRVRRGGRLQHLRRCFVEGEALATIVFRVVDPPAGGSVHGLNHYGDRLDPCFIDLGRFVNLGSRRDGAW